MIYPNCDFKSFDVGVRLRATDSTSFTAHVGGSRFGILGVILGGRVCILVLLCHFAGRHGYGLHVRHFFIIY